MSSHSPLGASQAGGGVLFLDSSLLTSWQLASILRPGTGPEMREPQLC